LVQRALFTRDLGAVLSNESIEELAAYQKWRSDPSVASSTLASEISQLRSLGRQAEQRIGHSLRDLRHRPEEAAKLVELAGEGLGLSTIQTRVRAFQRFLMMGVSDYLGRQKVQVFRAALPRKTPKDWHDAGISAPGSRTRRRMPGPTPTAEALPEILEAGMAKSLASGAVAALVCFSGLDVKEMLELHWQDLTWRDDEGSPHWEVKVIRRGHEATLFVVGPGAHALLRHGLSSGLQRDAFVLTGRARGTALSERALRYDLRASCGAAGWPRATRPQLIATLAAWLRDKGIDDHSIRLTLGRRRAASIDRMLHRQNQLDAQTLVDSAVAQRRMLDVTWMSS